MFAAGIFLQLPSKTTAKEATQPARQPTDVEH
jgi:hypothetical protein